MNIEITWKSVLALIAIPATVAGAVTAWNTVGWQTPEAHEHDMEIESLARSKQYEALVNQQKAFRDEWWCDEEAEYLDDLLAAQDMGDTSAWIEQEILEQRQKMERVQCDRFDKD